MITAYTVAYSESDVSVLMDKGYQPYGNIVSHNGNITQAMVIYTEQATPAGVTPLDNTQQLDLLVRYANDIYTQLIGRSNPNWSTFDTMHGLLSQLSNILRGIHDEVQTLTKPIEVVQPGAHMMSAEHPMAQHEEIVQSLPPELRDVDTSLVGDVVDANRKALQVGDIVRRLASDIPYSISRINSVFSTLGLASLDYELTPNVQASQVVFVSRATPPLA